MRIAVASEGLDVSGHFSCCTNFNYYKIENGEMVDSRNLPSQGHLCGSQANFLRQIEVKVLICGCISEKEAQSMTNAGITVVPGAHGRAFNATEAYLKGELLPTPV
ncbi:MAG: NifB/NifX family molybdenum-iron cluster-binding protein [Eggerthellaceae bacterium]